MYPLIEADDDIDMTPCKVYTHPHKADVTEIKVNFIDKFKVTLKKGLPKIEYYQNYGVGRGVFQVKVVSYFTCTLNTHHCK